MLSFELCLPSRENWLFLLEPLHHQTLQADLGNLCNELELFSMRQTCLRSLEGNCLAAQLSHGLLLPVVEVWNARH